MIWGNLLHLGYNMWEDREHPDPRTPYVGAKPYLRFDERLWNDLLDQMRRAGMNMVVIDLGEGVRYDSHPEIGVQDAWSTEKLRGELEKMRQMGLEPIPKMNFSTAHDAWLGEYGRMVSTQRYYAVIRELIEEVLWVFDKPRFFHIGMDEETAAHQNQYEYVVVRQYDLWWHDLLFYVEEIEKGGSRAWMWADYVWHHPDLFYERMPRKVLQSNWYYDTSFDLGGTTPDDPYRDDEAPRAYLELDRRGYDQIPTGSNWSSPENMEKTVAFCQERLAPERLLGFLTAPWHPTVEEYRAHHVAAIEQMARAKAIWDGSK